MSKEIYEFACDCTNNEMCRNCIHLFEVHYVPIKSKAPVKIKYLCMREGKGFEVDPREFCDFFAPKFNPPKDDKLDKLEIVYHGHTVVLSNTTDGIRVEIKEKKDES